MKRPMIEVAPAANVPAAVSRIMAEVMLPNWAKRCGERCGERCGAIYTEVIAPIMGVKLTGG